jgi:hypothetical protein
MAAQKPNVISEVVRDDTVTTKGGYWLIHVMDVQERPLTARVYQMLSQTCLDEWVQGLMKDAKFESLVDSSQKDAAIQKVTKTRSK